MPDIPQEAAQAADSVELTDSMLVAYEAVLDALRPCQCPDGTLHASAARVAARVVSTLARKGLLVSPDDIRADERRKVAEEIAAEIERVVVSGDFERPKYERGGFFNDARWAARIARQSGEARA